ncbi:hypothetical protein [Nonomuraea salmonea]|uniref:hypothetical protein n=1 Tax=Nonomuraea salmonea TaxID=46181 RepID=UPI002FEA7735
MPVQVGDVHEAAVAYRAGQSHARADGPVAEAVAVGGQGRAQRAERAFRGAVVRAYL